MRLLRLRPRRSSSRRHRRRPRWSRPRRRRRRRPRWDRRHPRRRRSSRRLRRRRCRLRIRVCRPCRPAPAPPLRPPCPRCLRPRCRLSTAFHPRRPFARPPVCRSGRLLQLRSRRCPRIPGTATATLLRLRRRPLPHPRRSAARPASRLRSSGSCAGPRPTFNARGPANPRRPCPASLSNGVADASARPAR